MSTPTSAISFTQQIAAGATLPVQISGQEFYFPVLTGTVFARPNPGGNFCQYVAGQGLVGAFTSLEIQNPNPFPVVFQVFATPQGFVDKRLIQNQSVQNVVNAFTAGNWVQVGEGFHLNIPDLSGQYFNDVTGKQWIALSRNSLSVQNVDSTDFLALEAGLFPGTSLVTIAGGSTLVTPTVLNASGNFCVATAAAVDALVFEIYQAVAPGFAGQPPN